MMTSKGFCDKHQHAFVTACTYCKIEELKPAAEPREWFVHLRLCGGAATLSVKGEQVGVAFCSPTEQFSRKLGRKIATGRRESETALSFALPPFGSGETGMTLRDAVVEQFYLWLTSLPERVAPRWLPVGVVRMDDIRPWSHRKPPEPWYVKKFGET